MSLDIEEPLELDVFGDLLEEMSDDNIEASNSSIGTTNMFDSLSEITSFGAEDTEDDELDEKEITSIEEQRDSIKISLAQYLRLWQKESTVNSLSVDTQGLTYPELDDSKASKFIQIYLSNIPLYNDAIKDLRLFTLWYSGFDDKILEEFGEDVSNKLKTFLDYRLQTFQQGEELYKANGPVLEAELKAQIKNRQLLDERYSLKQDRNLANLIETSSRQISISAGAVNIIEEKKMSEKYGIPITPINSGDLVTLLEADTTRFYSMYTMPTRILMSTSNKMMFQCECGTKLDAEDAIKFVEDHGGSYHRVRPVTCTSCGKKLLLNQVLIFRFASILFAERKFANASVLNKNIHSLGLNSLLEIELQEDELHSPAAVRRVIQSIDTTVVADLDGVQLGDDKEFVDSFLELLSTQMVKSRVLASDACILNAHLLNINSVDVSTKGMTDYIYCMLKDDNFVKSAICNKANRTARNTNKLKAYLLELSENPVYTAEVLNKKLTNKTFLKTKIKESSLEAFDIKRTIGLKLEEVVDNVTLDDYVKVMHCSVDETEVYYSEAGSEIEKFLVDESYRETLISNLFVLFCKNISTKRGKVYIPKEKVITSELGTVIGRLVKNNRNISAYDLYTVFAKDGAEYLYVASKNFESVARKYYTYYKPQDSLEMSLGYQYYLNTLSFVSSISEIKSLYFGITDGVNDETRNPWIECVGKAILLEALVKVFDSSLWRDEQLYDEIEIYLDVCKQKALI